MFLNFKEILEKCSYIIVYFLKQEKNHKGPIGPVRNVGTIVMLSPPSTGALIKKCMLVQSHGELH